jgi:hypothetical protein
MYEIIAIYRHGRFTCSERMFGNRPLISVNHPKKNKKTIDIAGIIWKEAYNIR